MIFLGEYDVFLNDDDTDVYNKLNEYCNITDSLTDTVDKNQDISLEQKINILYPIVDEIKDLANTLIESYIEYVKDKDNIDKLLFVKENINILLEKIDFFRNKIYDVYKLNNS